MVTVDTCCYCFNLRQGCVLSALWLLTYFTGFTFLMYFEATQRRFVDLDPTITEYHNDYEGFWVLGITFLIMDAISFALLFGAIVQSIPIIFIFMVAQIVPMSVECYYLLIAALYDLELNSGFMYLLPMIILLYIDLVAYSFWCELRHLKQLRSRTYINIEY